jgi:hypothetical protein
LSGHDDIELGWPQIEVRLSSSPAAGEE